MAYSYLDVDPDYDKRAAKYRADVLEVTPPAKRAETERVLDALAVSDKAYLTMGAAIEAFKRGECAYPHDLIVEMYAARAEFERVSKAATRSQE